MTTQTKEEADQELWDQLEAKDATGTAGDPAATTTTETKVETPTKTEATKATATAQPAGSASQEEDPFADLPPHVKDFIAGQKAQNDALNKRLKSVEGTMGGMKTQLEAARVAQAQVKESGAPAPTTQQIATASASQEGWAKLVKQYPEFSEAIEERLAKVQPQGAAAQQIDQTKLTEFIRSEIAAGVAVAKDKMSVENKHPGWEDFTQTPGFVGWVQRQKPEVQKLYSSDKPSDVIRLLDLHYEDNKASIKRQTRLGAAAAAAGPGSAKSGQVKSESELSGQELWDTLDKQGR